MATKLNTIKTNIQTILNGLVTSGILKDVQMDDFKKGVFQRNFSAFPVAILTTPQIDSGAVTNVQNLRTYTFEILVIMKADDVTAATDVEDLIENILNTFDNDPTLKAGGSTGAADGAVEPSASSPEAVSSGSNDYIAFSIMLRAKAVRDLTFT